MWIRLMSIKFCSLYLCFYLYFCVCDCISESDWSTKREGTYLMQVGEIKPYEQYSWYFYHYMFKYLYLYLRETGLQREREHISHGSGRD